MKPNFALSLSFDGIRMLHRASAGWHLVGEVSLEAADLAGELAMLRRTALALDKRGLRTKLLLPNEQVRYLALDSTRAGEDDVRAALDGATPYAVADLVYDYSRGGGRTYVAAVARETLEEAEAFASEHKLNPVCFAAVPEPFTYMGGVFFGPTAAAASLLPKGETPERDDTPVEVIGRAELPELDAPAVEAPEAPVVVPAVSNAGPPPELQPIPEPDLPEAEAPEAPEPIPMPEPEAAPETETEAKAAPETETEAETEAEGTPAPEEPVVFSSRARPNGNGDATAPPRPAPEAPLPRLDPPAPDAGSEPMAVPTFRRSADNDAPRTDPPQLAVPVSADPSGPPLTGASREPEAGLPPLRTPVPDPEPAAPPAAAPSLGPVLSEPPAAAPELAVAPAASLDPAPEPDQPDPAEDDAKAGGFFKRRKARPESKTAASTATDDEARKMTVFGARKPAGDGAAVGGKPRYLGLILTLILLLFMAAVAAMAAISENGFSAWFGGSSPEGEAPTEIAASAPAEPVAPAGDAPSVEVMTGTADAPDPTGSETDASLAAITEAVASAASSEPAAAEESAEAAAAPAAEPQAQQTPVADTGRLGTTTEWIGRVLTPAEAERIYAATGVWQRAPRVQIEPRPMELSDLRQAGLDAGVTAQVPSDLPRADPFSQDLAFLAPADPPPPDLRFDRDEDGFVVATEEGAATPEGAIVYAGSPALLPPPRPGSVIAAAASAPEVAPSDDSQETAPLPELTLAPPPLRPETEAAPGTTEETAGAPGTEPQSPQAVTPGGVSLAAFRPEPRPGDLDVPAPDAASGIAPEAASGIAPANAIRPAARPENLAPPEAAEDASLAAPEEADPLASASDYAVARSLRPDTRPRNFDRVVERARAQQQRQQAAAAAASAQPQSQPARAVAPSGPTTTTVAQAATRNNAINLRQINLIGVYGSPGDRRALVRLGNGRYVKVGVGDRLDGGQVAAIGDSALRYVKRGRNVVLEIPNG